jgi:selenoprotein W-related protein
MAQELLTTFTEQIKGVTLIPSEKGGTFQVCVNERLIFDRKEHQRFPEIKELKRLVRDLVSPEMDLGHTDQK